MASRLVSAIIPMITVCIILISKANQSEHCNLTSVVCLWSVIIRIKKKTIGYLCEAPLAHSFIAQIKILYMLHLAEIKTNFLCSLISKKVSGIDLFLLSKTWVK